MYLNHLLIYNDLSPIAIQVRAATLDTTAEKPPNDGKK